MPSILPPPPDVELGLKRTPLEYLAELPSAGVTPETGMVLYLHGWGLGHDDSYARKLLRHLAETYNCIAVSLSYQDSVSFLATRLMPAPNFFAKLAEHYGIGITAPTGIDAAAVTAEVIKVMGNIGMTELHPECHLLKGEDGYVNFGVIAALDVLTVTSRVLADYPVNRRRLFVLGTSYGGYLGLLLSKLAPHTFRMIVDNSGFVGPNDTQSVYGMSTFPGPPRIQVMCPSAFSRHPDAPNFFRLRHRLIREVAAADHYQPHDATHIYSYHSRTDRVADPREKHAAAQVLARFRPYDLRFITEHDLDGRAFKTTEHAMQASLRALFEMSYARWLPAAATAPAMTDFDLGTVNRLRCDDADYVFRFSARGVTLAVEQR